MGESDYIPTLGWVQSFLSHRKRISLIMTQPDADETRFTRIRQQHNPMHAMHLDHSAKRQHRNCSLIVNVKTKERETSTRQECR